MSASITGRTAKDITSSVRALVDRGTLHPGDPLPPVRELAAHLEVNRNTVLAAYRQLTQAGVTVTRGREGTSVAQPSATPAEGFATDTALRDLGNGNPDPRLLPGLRTALASVSTTPVLYGQPVIDPGLAEWAWQQFAADQPRPFELQVTGGAVDAVAHLLAQALTSNDAVALEDPCFLTSAHTARLAGYRTVPVPVDDEGMTVDGLRAALADGVRAVVCTPRAHNPTGAALTAKRAAQLRELLNGHPYVLIIEDDHFSLLSPSPYRTIIGPDHERWALVRSVSKFLGPDLRLAVVAADPQTAARLSARLSPGVAWVSHLLQRLVHALLTDPRALQQIASAGEHYRTRNAAFVATLAGRGIAARAGDGLNVWVDVRAEARSVAAQLMRRGWLVRTGNEFALHHGGPSAHHLRLTVHDLDDTAAQRFADDLARALAAPPRP